MAVLQNASCNFRRLLALVYPTEQAALGFSIGVCRCLICLLVAYSITSASGNGK